VTFLRGLALPRPRPQVLGDDMQTDLNNEQYKTVRQDELKSCAEHCGLACSNVRRRIEVICTNCGRLVGVIRFRRVSGIAFWMNRPLEDYCLCGTRISYCKEYLPPWAICNKIRLEECIRRKDGRMLKSDDGPSATRPVEARKHDQGSGTP
jgi:hypothetical protein